MFRFKIQKCGAPKQLANGGFTVKESCLSEGVIDPKKQHSSYQHHS